MMVVSNAPLIAFAMALGWLKKKKEEKKMYTSDFRFTLLLLVQTGAGFNYYL